MASDISTTGRDSDKFMLRFPDGMRDRIAGAAKANGRTMNAEVVARLQASFDAVPSPNAEVAHELAQSRAQTITVMEFMQGSLCETVQAMYPLLEGKAHRDRILIQAYRMASSLLAAVRPGDYLLSKSELLLENPALARFLEEVKGDIAIYEKKQARTRRPDAAAS